MNKLLNLFQCKTKNRNKCKHQSRNKCKNLSRNKSQKKHDLERRLKIQEMNQIKTSLRSFHKVSSTRSAGKSSRMGMKYSPSTKIWYRA